jgi:S-adenosylmethionine:tRNA ribosyltransferase-isomerase
MKLSDFDYSLPKELIAQYPLKERDAARLLVLDRAKGTIRHCVFKDIADYLEPDDLLVLNDTKVLPARLRGFRLTGGKVEILLLNQKRELTFNALIKPSRLRLGEKINFNGNGITGTLSARDEISFEAKDIESIYSLGVMPLPPYIKRRPEELDNIYYQTVYAKEAGAIASPTAGLHFTQELIGEIRSSGVNIAHITLHVGYGTFKPVKATDIKEHKMEKERFIICGKTLKLLRSAKENGKKIFAVGTTSVRALETAAESMVDHRLPITNCEGSTDLFIYPGYKFKFVDCLLTNFHLPKTTLFMLVCAFAGEELIKKAYREAVDNKYRFYSYGDAMLIV